MNDLEYYLDKLEEKYQALLLSKKQTANEMGISVRTLEYRLKKGINTPTPLNKSGKVQFPIKEVAKYLAGE